ncbi:MAG: DUF1579 family protein [Planctomycetia bacterium]
MHGFRQLRATALLCFASALLTAVCLRAGEEPVADAQAGDAAAKEAEYMARMLELATPGPEHEALGKEAGVRVMDMEFDWMGTGSWTKVRADAVCKPILGGRYMQEDVSFTMEGMPMQGISIVGYDKLKGEYTSLWMDSMSTWWITSRGKRGADGVVDFKGSMVDLAGERPFRQTIKHEADGAIHMRMYDTIAGKEVEVMRSISRPAKSGK